MIEVGSVMCRSEPQMPQFFTRRISSFGPGTGSAIASIASGLDISLNNAARMDGPLDRTRERVCHCPGTAMGNVMGDLYATARQMLADLEARRVSARELLDAHVARNAALSGTINAVTVTDLSRARKDADTIDN